MGRLLLFMLLWSYIVCGCFCVNGETFGEGFVATFRSIVKARTSACYQKLHNLRDEEIMNYVDASGKPGAGVLSGNLLWLGDFEECMDIDGSHYCKMQNIEIQYQKDTIGLRKYGLCVPKECNTTEASELMEELGNKYLSMLGIHIIAKPITEGMYGPNVFCYKKDEDYSDGAIAMIVLSAIILTLCLIGTAIDMVKTSIGVRIDVKDKDEDKLNIVNHQDFDEKEVEVEGSAIISNPQKQSHISMHAVKIEDEENKMVEFFMCFSLIKNTKTLFNTTVPPGAITCLNGIRTISIMWVIMGHYLIFTLESSVQNAKKSLQWAGRWTMQPLLNGGAAVDTFFTLSGVLVAYLSLKRFDKHGKLPLVRYYLHRYIRLTPSYAYVIFFFAYIFPITYNGPDWSTGEQENNCHKYWWTNLLYINNFHPDSVMKICLSVSWYLANDMQFYVVSPIILWVMYKYNWKGIGVMATFILIVHCLTNGILIHEKHATPLFYEKGIEKSQKPMLDYQNYIYEKPYCRVAVYFVGLVLGYVIFHKYSIRSKFVNMFQVIGWSIAIPLISVLLYSPYNSTKTAWTDSENIAFGLVFRILWALCIAWVIFACHNKAGGVINDFLSWKAFLPLSRLTYGVYLFHIIIVFICLNSQRTPMYLTEVTFSMLYIGITVVSFACSYVLSVFIEYPVFNLEQFVLKFLNSRK